MSQLGFKQNAKTLATPVAAQDMVVVADRLLLIGGATDASGTAAGATANVQAARVMPDGSTTDFKIVGQLPAARVSGDTILCGGFIVQIGGLDTSSAAQSTIYVAPVNSEGAINGVFKTYAFPKATMVGHRLATYNGFVYVIGGGAANTQEVYYAKQQHDGSFGPWKATQSLPVGLSYHGAAFRRDGTLFVAGGINSGATTVLDGVYAAVANADGTLNAFKLVGSLQVPRWRHAIVVSTDKIYAIGGSSDTVANSAVATVEFAQFNANGTLGRFVYTGPLWSALRNTRAALKEGKVTATGGHSSSGSAVSTVMVAPVQHDGHL